MKLKTRGKTEVLDIWDRTGRPTEWPERDYEWPDFEAALSDWETNMTPTEWIKRESETTVSLEEEEDIEFETTKITVDVQLRPLLDDLEVDIDDIKEYISKLKENEQEEKK